MNGEEVKLSRHIPHAHLKPIHIMATHTHLHKHTHATQTHTCYTNTHVLHKHTHAHTENYSPENRLPTPWHWHTYKRATLSTLKSTYCTLSLFTLYILLQWRMLNSLNVVFIKSCSIPLKRRDFYDVLQKYSCAVSSTWKNGKFPRNLVLLWKHLDQEPMLIPGEFSYDVTHSVFNLTI